MTTDGTPSVVNVLLCGVGGQEIFRAGALLARAAALAGYDVKLSPSAVTERPGESVSCHVRWGRQVYAPVIRAGEADFILSLERMETLRYLGYAKRGVDVLVNDLKIPVRGDDDYPENVEELVAGVQGVFHVIPANALAEGDPLIAPVALLGAFASFNQCTEESWIQAISQCTEYDRDDVLRAYHAGRAYIREPHRIEVAHREETHAEPDRGIRTFDALLERVRTLPKRRVAIAGAQNVAALHAGVECLDRGLGTPVLVGPAAEIARTARERFPDFDLGSVDVVDARDDAAIADTSVALVRGGQADMLLKGGVNTPTLMRAVLHGKTGLRAGLVLSDTFVFEYPDEDGIRLVMITDGGVTLQPTIQQKVEIVKNAVVVAHALGNATPRVALLAASETINPNVAATMDAAVITKMNRTGQIPGCVVEGPIALDVAVSRKAASIKGTASEVAGRADILVTASIDTANVLAKSTTYFAGYRLSHVIVGGTAPILIPSRSDTSDAKFLSIALGSLMAKWFEERRAQGA